MACARGGCDGDPAAASLIGDSVHYERIEMGIVENSADFIVVGGMVELLDMQALEVDVEADQIILSVALGFSNILFAGPVRLEFTSLDWSDPGGIASVQVNSADAQGFDAGQVSFSVDSATIVLDDVTLLSTGFIEVSLPEPTGAATALALALGFAGLGKRRTAKR